ncbi:plasmid mobilization relaxosome protein MobC [Nitrosospira sp. NRS527]|uniref:plasmid mobilization relaxosome protein MobC n=1 Tax=Nitrosospira sp. NRS527 TaxID=155925 RepID=UPI001AF97484|nr:plasmid mobilization relaxosome protein MobC [Nitrosospira sp. NRS527]BCT69578.1 hypothetical protein NNRS527_03203 [Nitrosospira sp. NRS527]
MPERKPDPNPIRTFRLGPLSQLLDNRAKRDQVKTAVIVRRALREYLGKGAPAASADTAPLVAALEQTRLELSRIGGNLNQLAHAFNMDERMLDRAGLATVHRELQIQFGTLIDQLIEVRNALRTGE